MTNPPRKSRLVLVLMSLLFFGPLMVAIGIYYGGDGQWRPSGTVAHGILLSPPPSLPAGEMELSGGTTTDFYTKWSLLYVGDGDCDSVCKEALYQTRQVRRALGKEMSRVQRLFVSTGKAPDAGFLAANQPDLLVIADGVPARDRVLAALGTYAAGDVYIADPLGNLILRFPAGTSMKNMHADLQLLLKASQIG
ncbi:MAG: SCO family protein [Gammaproteobacteria bacterium]